MALRGSLSRLAQSCFAIGKQNPGLHYNIVRHPDAKYYTLCDAEEFDRLLSADNPHKVEPVFSGSLGELYSLVRSEKLQLELFEAVTQYAELNSAAIAEMGTEIPQEVVV